MAIYNNVEELIGNTPLMRLRRIEEKYSLSARLYAKLGDVDSSMKELEKNG